ncbi:MAG: hypothetical protein OXD31_17035 [Chloroflexi bacterium]|nr:hypothetical protein [Chloroflexota bacterium]
MTEIKIDMVDSVTRLQLQETITYAERNIATNHITLTEGEKAGIEALREELESYSEVSIATIRMDSADARDAHSGILKGLPAGSSDMVSTRFYATLFDVALATETLDEFFTMARPVGYDLVVTLLDKPSFPRRWQNYYLGVTEEGETVAIKVVNWDRNFSRLGSQRCRWHKPVMQLVDCAESRRTFPCGAAFPADLRHRRVYCSEMRFSDARQREAYERAARDSRLAESFDDILAGGDRLAQHIENEVSEIDKRVAELTSLRDSIKR